ncbi:helix-turn-helix transcriptional regulator [Clostridium sp. D2Q-11]|uniref:Helix-turn-helix transcriptional regulator n=1 Tax=Anaeromonas frigoriresistens TaxID=2683708 RepID=A0A942UXV8_9FIRM|nr:AraC family transcriptional regulator [Anaeromonas frigoriresistens]MBS4538976.1 helix-turn-helix transcriptional regulator [Anaeromonas frigoriresistens]
MSINTVESMVNWIEVNIKRNPTLPEMSNYVGYSQFYCSNKFHEYVGITFKQYLSKRKLTLAAMEVKNTQDRLLDIALKYGFSCQESFTRAFVDAFGCTPNQYRKTSATIQLYMRPTKLPVENVEFLKT